MGEKSVFGFRRSPSSALPAALYRSRSLVFLWSGLTIILLFLCTNLHAYRPFFTADAWMPERGEWLAGIGVDELVRGGVEQQFRGPNVKIDFGFAKDWEATASGAVRLYENGNVNMGVEDISAGIKCIVREGLFQGKRGPSIAAEIDGLFLSKARGEPYTGFSVRSSLSNGAGPVRFHSSLGIEYGRAVLLPGIVWGGVGEYFVTRGISLVGEVSGNAVRESLPETVFLAGIISRTAIGTFDLGIWKRSSDAFDDISFTVGTTVPLE